MGFQNEFIRGMRLEDSKTTLNDCANQSGRDVMKLFDQCDQIWRFIGLWATF